MKNNLTVTFLICLLMPTQTLANCSEEAVTEVLSQNGYTYEFIETDDDGDHFYRVVKDGSQFTMTAESDGDLSFTKFYNNDLGLTNDNAAEVMEAYKYLQVYIDSDGDLAMQYHVAVFGEPRCHSDLSAHVRFYMSLVERARQYLAALKQGLD